ncbi:MAG: FAD-dependent oxidoreductase [Anaerolineales bacterium]
MPNDNQSNKQKYDIIIVGAGPAGISTALHLAKLAPELVSRTLILEKACHPRPKLCGGGILPDAEVVLHSLNLDINDIPHVDVDWARFDFDGHGMRMRGEKGGRFAFRTIRRYEFDAWLAGKARERGFAIIENTTVKKIDVRETEVVVTTDKGEYHTVVVVGADGSNSLVRRAIIPQEDTHVARLLEIVTEPRPERSSHIQTDSYFDFVYVPQGILGYSWDFPALEGKKPVRVRGIYDSNVYPLKTDVSLRDALADELNRHGYDLKNYKLEGHPLRWFEANSIFSAPRVLLAGDAAGVDALFGEGISIALGYGGFAARALVDAFAQKDFSFIDYRRLILRSEMGKSLRRRTWWAKFYYHLRWQGFQRLVWHHLGAVVTWVMQHFMIGWARRGKRKA